ncbi:MAG TPA: ADOP family duplicated permease [Thermoanaerobaculia bacterium]|nr:ADOP family duplicated permease [Thermoanaerobaculia bacterium]
MTSLALDLRAAWRRIRFSPGPAIGVVVTLGLGIAAVVTMHAVLQAVLLAPLPYPDPAELVRLYEINPRGERFTTSQPNYLDFAATGALEDLAALVSRPVTVSGRERPQRALGAFASASIFPLLDVEARYGRVFGASDDTPGAAEVAVLSAGLAERLGGEPETWPGRSIRVDGTLRTVVGVLPSGFDFPPGAELWLPLQADAGEDRGDHWLTAIGRLRAGVDQDSAEAELATVAERLGREYPETNRAWGIELEPFADMMLGNLPTRLWTLGGASAALLLLACANAAGLLLVQGSARRRELAVRAALGAGTRRLVRQLLVEGLVLAAAATVVAVAVGLAVVPWLRRLLAEELPRADQITVAGPTLAAAVAASLVAAVLSSLAPARRAASGVALASGSRGVFDAGARRLQSVLIVGQIALATVLLVAGGLLARSVLQQHDFATQFDMERTLVVPLSLQRAGIGGEQITSTVRAIREAAAALPGVEATGVSNIRPFSGTSTVMQFAFEGRAAEGPEDAPFAGWRLVSPETFAVAGVEPLAGEIFAGGREDEDVAVVSRDFAEQLLPGAGLAEVVGRRIAFGWNGENWRRIVAVVPELRDVPLSREALPTVYLPFGGWPDVTLLVRASAAPAGLAEPLRQAIWEVDEELAVPTVSTIAEDFRATLRQPRLQAGLMSTFAAVAVGLAMVGLVGVVAYSARRRRQEIGVRMALGARPTEIRRLFIVQGLKLGGAGVALGLIGGVVVERALRSQLAPGSGSEVSASDPGLLAVVALVLIGGSVAAALGPARRAATLEASATLRAE